jgi:cytochrome c peroxidase
MKRKTVILATLVLTAAMTVSAQRGPRAGRGGRPDILGQTRDALNLSPGQVDSLRALLDARAQSDRSAQGDIQSRVDALAAAQEKSPADARAIEAAERALRDAEAAPQRINDNFRTDFLELLTADQRKTLDNLAASAPGIDALSSIGVIDRPSRGIPGPRRGGLAGLPPPPRRGARGPRGPAPQPPGIAPSPEKVSLGKQLFFDKRLSADGTLSCASCHAPEHAFSDGKRVSSGIHGATGTRNAPALVQAAFSRSFFWDGRAATLERQVLQPILNPNELGLTETELERRTARTSAEISDALASYVRTIRSTDSRYDRYQRGDSTALTAFERAGLRIFRGKGQCAGCHGGPNFTDDRFHNTGIAWQSGRFTDEGRYAVTLNERDHGAFKTPTLREIARTAPYMHDGSLAALEDVIAYYAQGGQRNPYLDRRVRPLRLSAGEQKALVAFLKTLSGEIHDGM